MEDDRQEAAGNGEDYTEDDIELVTDDQEADAADRPSASTSSELDALNSKYLRLYADFENYRKRVNKDKEELVRYGNESLIYELLPVLDNLELALKHATGDLNAGLVQGVEVTLKELHRTLEKFGVTRIAAQGQPFDPAVHHAMSQVERADLPEKLVAEEFRAGYRYRDKVLRPSLVSVSTRPKAAAGEDADSVAIKFKDTEEEEQ